VWLRTFYVVYLATPQIRVPLLVDHLCVHPTTDAEPQAQGSRLPVVLLPGSCCQMLGGCVVFCAVFLRCAYICGFTILLLPFVMSML